MSDVKRHKFVNNNDGDPVADVAYVLASDYDALAAKHAAVVEAAERFYKGKTESREAEREIGDALSALDEAVRREVPDGK